MSIDLQIKRIKDKLSFLQEKGWEAYEQNFAFFSHQLKMNPPIPLEELLEFEQTYNLKLPEGYRRFLLEIGNGGAGPYYGIIPLEKRMYAYVNDINDHPYFGECKAHPLPDKNYGVRPEDEWLDDWAQGTITLCNQGCNYHSLLVVRGEEEGRICYSAMMGEPYYMPDPDFLSWYERWLDEVLSGQEVGWFGGYGWMETPKKEINFGWRLASEADFSFLKLETDLEMERLLAQHYQRLAKSTVPESENFIQISFDL